MNKIATKERIYIFESTPGSLTMFQDILSCTNKNYFLTNSFVKHLELLNSPQIVIFEVVSLQDAIVLNSLSRRNFSLIIVLRNKEMFQEILTLDVTAFVTTPMDILQIERALEKSKQEYNHRAYINALQNTYIERNNIIRNTILIPTREGYEVIRINDILQVQADRAYCIIYLLNGRKMIVSKPLREIEVMLPQEVFFRSHISHLVNVNFVICYRKEDGGVIVLSDGSKVPVTKKRKEDLVEVLTLR